MMIMLLLLLLLMVKWALRMSMATQIALLLKQTAEDEGNRKSIRWTLPIVRESVPLV